MKKLIRRTLSLLLAATLLGSVSLTALASDALGEDLTAKDTLLNEETELSTNVFWSTAYSDLRTENLITYSPNKKVTPIVTYGDVITARETVSVGAKQLEDAGYRVVAGINGDFYNVNTGLPIGILVTEGVLHSSDAGYYAVGFRDNGKAVIGKPGVKVSADLGYDRLDGFGTPTRVVRQLAGVNKARVSTGGIYLYTYEFNAKHTTGNTEPGVDVVCTIEKGRLSIGDTVTLSVDRVVEADSATAIRKDQVVLSANLKSDPYHVDALREIPEGGRITLTLTAADEAWNDVEYAVGALYSLVENGEVVSGLPAGVNPRTAVGQKRDGTLLFYTIDGRKSGHSIGASLTQVAQRLIELGCETAICLDGGGSTTLAITEPDELTAKTVNRPSDGGERAVTNQIFLVADSRPSGRLSHFYVSADSSYVLAGSKVNISAAAVDTNFIPMDKRYDLSADSGELDGHVLTTPKRGGEITVTAQSGGKRGRTTVYAVETPDDVAIRNANGNILTELTAAPGTTVQLTATAAYQHMPLKADPEAFEWSVRGRIGTIDETGAFTASAPGKGSIVVSAGGRSAEVEVTVSKLALQTVEDFEGRKSIFSGGSGEFAEFDRVTGGEQVRLGRGSGKLDYTLTEELGYGAEWLARDDVRINRRLYNSLNLWVCGDNSGNTLSLLYSDGEDSRLEKPVTVLDFTGWKQVTVDLSGDEEFAIQGLRVSAGEGFTYDDGFGELITEYPETVRTGSVYLDQIVASFDGAVDHDAPVVTLSSNGEKLTATILDAVDDLLPKSAVSVTWDGREQDFAYNESTGTLAVSQISDGRPHRITVTARDASGNIGRASYDVPVSPDWTPRFTDTQDYWAAAYVDFLYDAGITTGYDDGSFRPNQSITRAQFSVMLYRYLGLDESKYADVKLPFADNKAIPEYAVPAIKALYTEGVINGSTGKDGRVYFNPGSSLTRAQAATMIGRTQEKGYAAAELTFTDRARIPAYAEFYIRTMAAQGVIGGYADGSFKPNNNITRGQMAKILYTLM